MEGKIEEKNEQNKMDIKYLKGMESHCQMWHMDKGQQLLSLKNQTPITEYLKIFF